MPSFPKSTEYLYDFALVLWKNLAGILKYAHNTSVHKEMAATLTCVRVWPCVFSCWICALQSFCTFYQWFPVVPLGCLAWHSCLLNQTCFWQIICIIYSDVGVSKKCFLYLQWFAVNWTVMGQKIIFPAPQQSLCAHIMIKLDAAWMLCLTLTQIAVIAFWNNY